MIQPGESILLTGATGFVGSRLWPELHRAGYRVRCLSRDVEGARRRWPEREWVAGDVGAPEPLEQALAEIDALLSRPQPPRLGEGPWLSNPSRKTAVNHGSTS